jgi:hypothetical protein
MEDLQPALCNDIGATMFCGHVIHDECLIQRGVEHIAGDG